MKIKTLEDLAQFINSNEYYNVEVIENAIAFNNWYVYNTDDETFVCHDFLGKVELTENGAQVYDFIDEEGHEYIYNGKNVCIRVDVDNYYIDFHNELGEGIYNKSLYCIREALYDQANIYNEAAQYDVKKDSSLLVVSF